MVVPRYGRCLPRSDACHTCAGTSSQDLPQSDIACLRVTMVTEGVCDLLKLPWQSTGGEGAGCMSGAGACLDGAAHTAEQHPAAGLLLHTGHIAGNHGMWFPTVWVSIIRFNWILPRSCLS